MPASFQINSIPLPERQFRHVRTACVSLGLHISAIKLAQVLKQFAFNMNFGSVVKCNVGLIKHHIMSKYARVEA